MILTVLGFNITAQDKSQIIRMLTAAGIKDSVSIQDTRSSSVNLRGSDVVLIFGRKALLAARPAYEAANIPVIEFPEMQKLYPPAAGGDKTARDSAWEKLTKLTEDLKTGKLETSEDQRILNELTEDMIPDLSLSKIQALEKVLKETKKTSWKCTTKSGKIVCISLQPLEGSSKMNADIYITFHELFALRAAMDIFQISEVTFVSNSSDQRSSQDASNNSSSTTNSPGNQVPG